MAHVIGIYKLERARRNVFITGITSDAACFMWLVILEERSKARIIYMALTNQSQNHFCNGKPIVRIGIPYTTMDRK